MVKGWNKQPGKETSQKYSWYVDNGCVEGLLSGLSVSVSVSATHVKVISVSPFATRP